jgi:hypothetical protein
MVELTFEVEKAIISNIRENIKEIKFGSFGAVIKIHEQAIVDVTYTKTESQRDKIPPKTKEGD